MRLATPVQMRRIDEAAVERAGEIGLMAEAGRAIAWVARRYAADGTILAFAGAGNNGGDAFAALAELAATHQCIAYHDPAATGSAARIDARDRALAAGVALRPFPERAGELPAAALLLDGVLGVNARVPLDEPTARLTQLMTATGVPILALDCATGTDPATGALDASAVHAAATIAIGFPKRGSLLEPGRRAAGDLWCARIGMRDCNDDGDDVFVTTAANARALFPRRDDEAEKRSSGAPLIVAGSEQFPGAAILCARGAQRAGAGYVTVATPRAAAAALRAHLIEAVVVTFDDSDPARAAADILDLTNHSSSIAIGPGMGLGDTTGKIVRKVIEGAKVPVVIDAGALFHIGKHLDRVDLARAVLTPHAGEFARLSGRGTIADGERLERIRAFVAQWGITTLLKGRTTLVADRNAVYANPSGTAALATAGTGDVLSGIIATLLSQGLQPLGAARLGAFWHGRAGGVAQEARDVGVIASDVAEALGVAAREIMGTSLDRDVPVLIR